MLWHIQERKEREAQAAEGGWTVVVHHKGRKKTTDVESGTTVGSVAKAVVEDNMKKKKREEVKLDFYRFQRREAQRNGKIWKIFFHFFSLKTVFICMLKEYITVNIIKNLNLDIYKLQPQVSDFEGTFFSLSCMIMLFQLNLFLFYFIIRFSFL